MQEAVQNWIYDPNVMLIDFGWPEHGGELDKKKLAIRVHVKQKFPLPALEVAIEEGKTREVIPDELHGFEVDKPEGIYRLHPLYNGWWWVSPPARARRADPMRGGISISDAYRNVYATLGCLVKDRDTRKEMILSNWHVLVGNWGARAGQPIIQPGRSDGGSNADIVAKLTRDAMSSGLDAAVAELTGGRRLINDQFELGPVKGVGWAELGMKVVKSGRRTAITYGLVTAVDGTLKMSYNGVDRLIRSVVTIEPRPGRREASAGGDSGSIWLEESTMRAVGLHFAGSDDPERALAMDMQPVLDALHVNMID
jgi:endonuclease G